MNRKESSTTQLWVVERCTNVTKSSEKVSSIYFFISIEVYRRKMFNVFFELANSRGLTAAYLFREMQAYQRPSKCGFGLSEIDFRLRDTERSFGAFGRLAGTFHIDFVSHFSGFGHDHDVIILHLDKSAGNREELCVIAGAHANLPGLKLRQKRRVVRENAQFAIRRRNNYGIRLGLQNPPVRRQDINGYGHKNYWQGARHAPLQNP